MIRVIYLKNIMRILKNLFLINSKKMKWIKKDIMNFMRII